MDNTQGIDFDRVREKLDGLPGFLRQSSTIESRGDAWVPEADYIVETVRILESKQSKTGKASSKSEFVVFLRWVGPHGSGRIVLPAKVMDALYRHRYTLINKSRKSAGKQAFETRQAKLVTQGNNMLDEINDE